MYAPIYTLVWNDVWAARTQILKKYIPDSKIYVEVKIIWISLFTIVVTPACLLYNLGLKFSTYLHNEPVPNKTVCICFFLSIGIFAHSSQEILNM